MRAVPEPVPGRRGLPAWTAANRPIEDTDVVLWYVFGIHHITRMEDWPIMPVDTVSFWLKPFGFFDRNPTLDVPPSPRTASTECCSSSGSSPRRASARRRATPSARAPNDALERTVSPSPARARDAAQQPVPDDRDRVAAGVPVRAGSGTETFALVGDSHAGHWRAAFE